MSLRLLHTDIFALITVDRYDVTNPLVFVNAL